MNLVQKLEARRLEVRGFRSLNSACDPRPGRRADNAVMVRGATRVTITPDGGTRTEGAG